MKKKVGRVTNSQANSVFFHKSDLNFLFHQVVWSLIRFLLPCQLLKTEVVLMQFIVTSMLEVTLWAVPKALWSQAVGQKGTLNQ